MAVELPDKLYHYTNVNALNGIIVKKKLWLGSLRHMNDTSEELYFMDLLKKAVIVSKSDVTATQRERIDSMFEKAKQELSESPACVSCFSKRKDDAAQWERYADQGAGFCIEFDAQKLDKFIRGSLFLQPVYYSRDVLKHEHVELILEWLENPKYTGGFNTFESWMGNIKSCACSFKHPSFEPEEEVRLVLLPELAEFAEGKWDYIISGGIIKKYFILDIEEIEKKKNLSFYDTINGIYIGPKSKQNPRILYEYFRSKDIDISIEDIVVSESPLQ